MDSLEMGKDENLGLPEVFKKNRMHWI